MYVIPWNSCAKCVSTAVSASSSLGAECCASQLKAFPWRMEPAARAPDKEESRSHKRWRERSQPKNQTEQPETPAAGGDRRAETALEPGACAVWQVPQVPLLVGTEDIRGVHVGRTPALVRIPWYLSGSGCGLRRFSSEAQALEAYTFHAEAYGAPLPARVFRRDDHD